MKRVADVVAGWLVDCGVTDVFLLPGGGAMHLNDGVACEERLTAIPCHHEQACGVAAEAYGRVGRARFGVAMVTTGPGATNVLTPVAGAWIESLPMMVIAGQVKRADALDGRPLRQGGVQEVDALAMAKPVTKFAVRVDDPLAILRVLDEALFRMLDGRPGPVWIDVPLDVQAAPVNESELERFVPPPASGDAPIPIETLNVISKLIAESERPLILAGHGVRISGAAENFSELVDTLGIPCVFTWNAADLLPWDHPLYVGRPGNVAARAPNFAVQNCDLLISIGARLDNIVTAYNPLSFARVGKKVVVDIDPNELNKHPFVADVLLCADAGEFMAALRDGLPTRKPSWGAWRWKCQDWKKRYLPGDRQLNAGSNSKPMSHIGFVEGLSNVVPEGTVIVTGSSGLAVEFFYTAFRNKRGQRCFLTSGLGAMGYGLPAAIGACIGAGSKPTLCIESDGSLMLNLQELATLKTLDLPIAIVVMNNKGYASIRNTQRNYFSSRYIGSNSESRLEVPDLAGVAQSFGIEAKSGEAMGDLSQFFSTLDWSRPSLFDMHLVTDEALSPKVAAIPQPDGSIISMPLEDMSPLLDMAELEAEMIAPLSPESRGARALT